MSIDWDKLKEDMGGNYKDYAPAGRYKVKAYMMALREVGTNGSIAQEFLFETDDNYAYPKATHWLSFKNDNWRQWHNKCLMELLGATEDQAKKAVEACESKGSKENIMKAYEQTYTRLLAKKPEVEIEVWPDGKYSRCDFTDGSVRMSRPEDEREAKAETGDEILDSAEEIELKQEDDLSIPF